MQTITDKIKARIYGHRRGWAFSAKDFMDLAKRGTVDKILTILRDSGFIRQVSRGIYDYPRISRKLRMQAPPDIDQVAHAFARKKGWRIQAFGPWAANLLGLTTQVPARIVYLTDGKRATIKVGNTPVSFRPTAVKDLDTGKCGLVIQALREIGDNRIDKQVLEQVKSFLTAGDCRKLLRKKQVTGWIYEVIKHLCQEREG